MSEGYISEDDSWLQDTCQKMILSACIQKGATILKPWTIFVCGSGNFQVQSWDQTPQNQNTPKKTSCNLSSSGTCTPELETKTSTPKQDAKKKSAPKRTLITPESSPIMGQNTPPPTKKKNSCNLSACI